MLREKEGGGGDGGMRDGEMGRERGIKRDEGRDQQEREKE